MFTNRISRFFAQDASNVEAPVQRGFVAVPAFAMTQATAQLYQIAYEQACAQVAQRRERERHAHEWN